MARNYKQENKTAKARGETGVGSKSGDATRHRAQRAHEKSHGPTPKGKEIDHKKPLKSGGSNKPSNTRTRTVHANRSAGGKSGSRAGKAAGGRKGGR